MLVLPTSLPLRLCEHRLDGCAQLRWVQGSGFILAALAADIWWGHQRIVGSLDCSESFCAKRKVAGASVDLSVGMPLFHKCAVCCPDLRRSCLADHAKATMRAAGSDIVGRHRSARTQDCLSYRQGKQTYLTLTDRHLCLGDDR